MITILALVPAYAADISDVAITRIAEDDSYGAFVHVGDDAAGEVSYVEVHVTDYTGPEPSETAWTLEFLEDDGDDRVFMDDSFTFIDSPVGLTYSVNVILYDATGSPIAEGPSDVVVNDIIGTVYTDPAEVVVGPDEVATVYGQVDGDVTVDGGMITIAGSVLGRITASGGTLVLDNATVTGRVRVDEGGSIDIANSTLNSLRLDDGEFDCVITSTHINDYMIVNGTGNVSVDNVSVTADATIRTDNLDLNTLSAGGDVILVAEDDLSVEGNVNAGGWLRMRSGGDIDLIDLIEQSGVTPMEIAGDNVTLSGTLGAGGDIRIKAREGLRCEDCTVDTPGTFFARGGPIMLASDTFGPGKIMLRPHRYNRVQMSGSFDLDGGTCELDHDAVGGTLVVDGDGGTHIAPPAGKNGGTTYQPADVKPRVDYWLCL